MSNKVQISNGKEYKSILDFAREYNVNYAAVKAAHNRFPELYMDELLYVMPSSPLYDRKKRVSVMSSIPSYNRRMKYIDNNNRQFTSLAEMFIANDFKPNTVFVYAKRHNMSPQEAFDVLLKKRQVG